MRKIIKGDDNSEDTKLCPRFNYYIKPHRSECERESCNICYFKDWNLKGVKNETLSNKRG